MSFEASDAIHYRKLKGPNSIHDYREMSRSEPSCIASERFGYVGDLDDLLATDRHMHNLVRELKRQNIALDEAKIFAQ